MVFKVRDFDNGYVEVFKIMRVFNGRGFEGGFFINIVYEVVLFRRLEDLEYFNVV